MKITASVLALALWPFHHRLVQQNRPLNVSTMTVVGAQDEVQVDRPGCEIVPEFGYMWLGFDGVAGFSVESCEAAYQDWRRTAPAKTVLYRA